MFVVGCQSSNDTDCNDTPAAVEEPPLQPTAETVIEQAIEPEPQTNGPEPIEEPVAQPPEIPPNPLRQSVDGSSDQLGATAVPLRKHGQDVRATPAFDPIKVNGPIFVGWPTPKFAMVITGRQYGYIEPCGCAGLDRMKGGMSRRYALLKTLREKGWPVVTLDVGGIARGFGRQAELKFQIMVDGMRKMGYDAIALGKTDLRLPAGELLSVTASVNDQHSPFLSANVALFGFDAGMTAKTRVVEATGMKIGITSVLGKKWQQAINNPEIEMSDPVSALESVLPKLKEQSDYLVLLAHATMEETLGLAEKFPEFDLVVTAGGAPEPPSRPTPIKDGKALLIEVGEKGMDAIVLGFYDDAEQPVRYQKVPLDSRFAGSADMAMLMTAYQEQLKREGFAGLGIRPVPHPQSESIGKFVGSEKCESCHEEEYDIWKRSGHGRAYRTLLEQDTPRNFDPECVSCHVVGWHPSKFFPYKGGYMSLEETPELIDTGCETCHGPGGNHSRAELGGDEALKEKLRLLMVITKEESKDRQCVTCHDLDNSPDFDFETYWPHIEHGEQ